MYKLASGLFAKDIPWSGVGIMERKGAYLGDVVAPRGGSCPSCNLFLVVGVSVTTV